MDADDDAASTIYPAFLIEEDARRRAFRNFWRLSRKGLPSSLIAAAMLKAEEAPDVWISQSRTTDNFKDPA
ncbi:MAG: hypothetical protein EOQ55_25080 [Mesorhizobium sp.]|uniref:hypothetical protein n=1 Tax=unclassified Mesorhizobium TaxID=325217 RepID=UPI000FE32B03|nr:MULTISPECIES: hypothetical protein [unclassified Mesorhizobium]MDF3180559.1 hypothetical protein [Mesorhizobium sp. P17.1]RWF99774.1 MAG: hypothetical protein EOQ54_28540 [Mesorhizobium sp.]RWG13728.1 MAG: hypothetical protein EOQ55_25080 [Mesorhizobium sp.]RWG20537.1 MAG: hypothetical protein EOQ53_09530 [Mesorhizobium sp.]RWG94823.1 MAG: hypothetical protein EOQ72_26320 [Mesorhizobium sp.]